MYDELIKESKNIIEKFWKWAGTTSCKYSINGTLDEKEEFEFYGWNDIIKLSDKILSELIVGEYNENIIEFFLLFIALDHEREEIMNEFINLSSQIPTSVLDYIFMKAIGYEQFGTRWQIAEVLGDIVYERSSIYLKCLINDINSYVQRRALMSLIKINIDEAVKFFPYMFKYSDCITKRIIKENIENIDIFY